MAEASRKDALIVTADPDMGQALRSELEAQGWKTVLTNSVGPVPKLLRRGDVELILVDEANLARARFRTRTDPCWRSQATFPSWSS